MCLSWKHNNTALIVLLYFILDQALLCYYVSCISQYHEKNMHNVIDKMLIEWDL